MMDQASIVADGGSDQMSEGTGGVAGVEVRGMKMKVMVAIDESEGSFYALKWALDTLFPTMPSVGASTPQASLKNVGMVFLVHVQPGLHEYSYFVGPGGTGIYTTSAVVDSVKKAQEERSAAIISRALQMCKDKLVKAETIILTGDPREMICQAAEQMHVDLLLLGSRGLGMLPRAFIGSVSDYCAHHAETPVVIVKPPMRDSKEH